MGGEGVGFDFLEGGGFGDDVFEEFEVIVVVDCAGCLCVSWKCSGEVGYWSRLEKKKSRTDVFILDVTTRFALELGLGM